MNMLKTLFFGHAVIGLWVRSFLIVYALFGLLVFLFSERLIFFPPPATYQDTPDLLKLPTRHGEKITAIYLPNSQATYTLIYSHGNAEDLGRIRSRLEFIRDIGFSVFAYDYRGYGTSQGSPSEQSSYEDIAAAYRYLTQERGILPGQIILYGRSVGGGPSVDLASREPVAGLILESTFTSTFRVAFPIPILPFDRFNNLSKIHRVRCPVLLMHGTQDEVIPFAHSQTLYRQITAPKQLLTVEGAGHNNLMEVAGMQYSQALQDFIRLLNRTPLPSTQTADL